MITYSNKEVYLKLLQYSRVYWKMFAAAILAMIIYAATDTGFAALMKPMLDGSFIEKDPVVIKMIPFLMMALFLLRGISGFFSNYCMIWVGRNVIKVIRSEIFSHLLHLPHHYYDHHSTGEILSKITYDVEQVAEATSNAITILVRDSLTIVGLLCWMIYLNAKLTLIFIIVGPIVAIIVNYVSKRFRKLSSGVQETMSELSERTEEAVNGQQVVKIFQGYEYEKQHFEQVNEKNRCLHMSIAKTAAMSTPLVQFIVASALAGIIYMATKESMVDKITVGDFMSFITAMMLLLSPIKRLTSINAMVQKAIAAGKSIFQFLDIEKEIDRGERKLIQCRGEIEFKQVTFNYGERLVLDDINFTVKGGQSIAFIGSTGSGKSTLLGLVARFYDINQGQIKIDGLDIQAIDLQSLRENIALVSQDVVLFNDTIAANIAYGSLQNTTEAAILQAAKSAHLNEFLATLKAGIHTQIGERGNRLSGGQRQRIAIARAILKNAPILILDEATSALDSETEKYIQQALDELMLNRTTFIIAHRLSTIENSDKIFVLEQGKIVEQGNHQQLLAMAGRYYQLHQIQKKQL